MDPSLLTSDAFWNDPAPFPAGKFPEFPELAGHVLFETSGSSGTPKWVALSKRALLASAAAVNQHLRVTSQSCWGLALPLHHVGGFGVEARAHEAGCRICQFGGRWEPRAFRDWLQRYKVTHTSLVPTQVHDLAKANLSAPPDLAAVVVGGGHLDSLTGQAARDLGWPVLASYGMTEACSQIATQPLGALSSPYQPAPIPLLPIWEARVNPDDGVLSIAGPALFSGYIADGKFLRREAEWHVTSDRAAVDEGMITPLGRADSRVKVLGELVDPEAIERELIEISEGKLAAGTFAVIAVPDQRAGNLLVPVYQSEIDSSVMESVLSAYAAKAPGFRRLQPAEVVEKFPRSELGKLRRQELTTLYQQRITRPPAPPA
jgi:O-succinylbenzoic acid--CoA ligase